MIYSKKVSVGSFLKKGVDIKEGDILEIANEGKQHEGEYGTQNIFLVKIKDKEGNISINNTSINGLIDAYGEDSLKWIGKKIKATKIKQNVAGKFLDVWYFSHPNAELTESGFVMPIINEEIPMPTDEDIPF